jgi:hypothetical protein
MSNNTFSSPNPVEIIPASRVAPLIAATERELEVLERTAAEAIAAADDAEEWERAATNEGSSSTWALIRIHREQCDEARRDAQVMIDLATRHAQFLISEARAEADELINGSHTSVSPVSAPPATPHAVAEVVHAPAPVPAPAPAPVPSASDNGSSGGHRTVASESVAPEASTRTAVLTQPRPGIQTVIGSPAPAELPTTETPAVTEPPAPVAPAAVTIIPVPPAIVEPPAAVLTQPVVEPASAYDALAREAVVVELTPPPAPSQPPMPAPAEAVAATDAGFWPAEGRTRRRLALPFSAVLEASAVLLILVFILLRLQ